LGSNATLVRRKRGFNVQQPHMRYEPIDALITQARRYLTLCIVYTTVAVILHVYTTVSGVV